MHTLQIVGIVYADASAQNEFDSRSKRNNVLTMILNKEMFSN